jgi:hypothetical protein
MANNTGYEVYFAAGGSITLDVEDTGTTWLSFEVCTLRRRFFGLVIRLADGCLASTVYKLFPTAVGVTTVVVIILVGWAFRSIAIPLRAVFSIALTLALVYACAIWVYQVSVQPCLFMACLHAIACLLARSDYSTGCTLKGCTVLYVGVSIRLPVA